MMLQAKLFSGTSNVVLASQIAKALGEKLSPTLTKRFSDGNTYVRLGESVAEENCVLIQSLGLSGVNNQLLELVFLLDAAKRAGSRDNLIVLPYFSYAKADRVEDLGTSLRAQVCAEILQQAGGTGIIAFDLHSPVVKDFFRVPVTNLSPVSLFEPELKSRLVDSEAVVVAPDQGYLERAQEYAGALGLSAYAGHKQRRDDLEHVADITIKGDFEGKTVVVVDDFTTSGNTLLFLVDLLKNRGAKKIIVVVTHCLLAAEAFTRVMNAPLDWFITTNSVVNSGVNRGHPKLKVISCAPLLAGAIKAQLPGG